MKPGEGKCLSKRLLPWIAAALVALAVGTGAFFGGMQMGINRQNVEMDSLLMAKNTIIGVLDDSLKSQQDSIVVLNDSIKNMNKKVDKRNKKEPSFIEQLIISLNNAQNQNNN